MYNDIKIFLSATTIKQMIPQINGEIDNNVIDGNTKFMQITVITDTMTKDFYDDFYNKFITTGVTFPAAYQYLKDNYIDWILAFSVWQNLILTQSYALNSAGLRLKTTDHSVAAEATDISFMRTYIQGFIDSKRKEMYRYIQDNPAGYELYFTDSWGDRPKISKFRIGKVPTDKPYGNIPNIGYDPGTHFCCE